MARLIIKKHLVGIYTLTKNYPGQATWGDPIMGAGLVAAIRRHGKYDAELYDKRDFQDINDYTICMYSQRDLKLPENGKKIFWLQVPREEEWLESETVNQFDGLLYASVNHFEKHKDNYGGIMLPMSADPELFCQKAEKKQQIIVFVGNYGLRSAFTYNRYLAPLIGMRNFMVFGQGWEQYPDKNIRQHLKGILPAEQLPSLYNQASIVLAITADQHMAVDMVTTRLFEAIGCNALVISDKVPMAMDMFPEGVHFVEDGHETKELVDYYFDANHVDERTKEMQEKVALAKKNFVDNLTFNSYVDGLIEYMEHL